MDQYPRGYFGEYYEYQSNDVWCGMCGGPHYAEECYYSMGNFNLHQDGPFMQTSEDWSVVSSHETMPPYEPPPTPTNDASARLLKSLESLNKKILEAFAE
ncbi:hypothetical protein L1987_28089 [Smallanthus sonchifolius]|uniref:Uncharacterized protein n=1 Tax=Smallanthus sonchifolius TaxID=185202 RepID=A0ACB9ICL9_9ASTR|nr:hypothetical protein L1987_28089 [Smallanthus sonchifolius]